MAKGGYQRRRIKEKKDAERAARRRARRNRTFAMWGIGAAIAGIVAVVVILMLTSDDKASLSSQPSGSPSASGAPSPGASLPAGCTQGPAVKKKDVKYSKPKMEIDTSKTYVAHLHTNCGDMAIALDAKNAPNTVNNFVFLARKKFYDNTIFHRVIPQFGGPSTDMIQGGDAVATNGFGTGGPGYSFDDENGAAFDKPGYLAMANSGPNTNGSQFFVLTGPWTGGNTQCPSPNGGCYNRFGSVQTGLDVVHRIASSPRDENDKPRQDVVLISVTIEEK